MTSDCRWSSSSPLAHLPHSSSTVRLTPSSTVRLTPSSTVRLTPIVLNPVSLGGNRSTRSVPSPASILKMRCSAEESTPRQQRAQSRRRHRQRAGAVSRRGRSASESLRQPALVPAHRSVEDGGSTAALADEAPSAEHCRSHSGDWDHPLRSVHNASESGADITERFHSSLIDASFMVNLNRQLLFESSETPHLASPQSSLRGDDEAAEPLRLPEGCLGAPCKAAGHLSGESVDQSPAEEAPFRLKLSTFQSEILLNVLAVGYAATGVVVKMMEGDGSPYDPSHIMGPAEPSGGCLSLLTSVEFTLRFASAAAASSLLLFCTRRRRAAPAQAASQACSLPRRPLFSRELLVSGTDLGFWMFLTYAGQAVGLQSTSAHDAALILTVGVVLVPFLEALDGARISTNVCLATALASTGLILLESGEGSAAVSPSFIAASVPHCFGMPAGHLWCLLGAVGSAVHVVRSEEHCARHSPLDLVTLQLITTAALGVAWALLSAAIGSGCFGTGVSALWSVPGQLEQALMLTPLLMVLLSGPLGTGICEWLELEALQYMKASTATLILTTSPLWASLAAFFVLGETMTPLTAVGAALIMLSSLSVQLLAPSAHQPQRQRARFD